MAIEAREVGLEDIKDGWLRLEEQGDVETVFQTSDWVSTWWRHLGHRGRGIVLAAYDSAELIGITPLYVSRMVIKGAVPFLSVMRLMGAGESDYQGFILKKSKAAEALRALLIKLRDLKWDIFWLSDVHPDTETARLTRETLEECGYAYEVFEHTPCPYIKLPESFEEYKASLSRNSRRNLTKYCNRVEKLQGLAYHKVTEPDEIRKGIETFMRLHDSRWNHEGQGGALSDTRVRDFHLDVSMRLGRYLDLKLLRLGQDPIAAVYSYDFGGSRCVYLPGMDMKYEYYSLGYVMTAYGIRDSIEHGMREYDFMRGDEKYKYHFTQTQRTNLKYLFSKSRLKLRMFLAVEGLA